MERCTTPLLILQSNSNEVTFAEKIGILVFRRNLISR